MKAIIYGTGSFAEYVSYVISEDSIYDICGFCVDSDFIPKSKQFINLPVVEFDKVEIEFPPEEYSIFIAVGDNELREQKFNQALLKEYNILSYISSKSTHWKNLIYGRNVFISEDSGIQPFTTIEDNCILIGAKLGHHSKIGKNSLLSCCYLAGNVTVGNNCFLGLNSAIKQGVTIGNHNIIGMGSTISKNTADYEIYSNNTTKKSNISSSYLLKKYLK